jgi:phosphatidylserine/phosphatidylglycerophosphate/cardiolipin synthase-like enzyme
MDLERIEEALLQTLDDGRLSRAERSALARLLAGEVRSAHDRDVVHGRAFDIARQGLRSRSADRRLAWLDDVSRLISASTDRDQQEPLTEVWFSPRDDCTGRIVSLLDRASRTADICVFTITDDRISSAVIGAFRRGVMVRVITDDAKALDTGSDVEVLAASGVPVRVDADPAHMHHKFAVLDRRIVLGGSYNWTRSASTSNQENLMVLDHPRLASRYLEEFDRLWRRFGGGARR